MSRLPLMQRAPDELLAWHDGQAVSVARFLHQAFALAEQLPPGRQLINLSRNRYRFALAFAAGIVAGRTTLLPPNRLPATIDGLIARYPGSVVISDQPMAGLTQACLDPTEVEGLDGEQPEIPMIEAGLLAAVVFTSGSTGPSSSIRKPWRTLHDSSAINADGLGLGAPLQHAVATVPPQHMWGLETSVLLPWFGPLAMASDQPFFAADVIAALSRLPEPRVLISTPVHLRTLAEAGLPLPAVARVFTATAPLHGELARQIEAACGGAVVDVYGCSEAGCLARRQAAEDQPWEVFPAFALQREASRCTVLADHLPEPVPLFDRLLFEADGRFRLAGRDSDLVNIAGKRASLADLTQTLLDIPGVLDGVIFQPDERSEGPVRRLAALVVAPGLSAATIRQQLRQRIDAAFMPRPLRLVSALPRAESGKLPRQNLEQLLRAEGEPSG